MNRLTRPSVLLRDTSTEGAHPCDTPSACAPPWRRHSPSASWRWRVPTERAPLREAATPADGAKVSEPFTVKFNASVPLGDPSTGEDHVHLCFDGASCDSGDYLKVYSDSAQVQGLSPGQHTIEASLRNADHSAVGPTATITVTVTGGATSSGSPSSGGGYGSPTSSASRGYGY
jgi:hypothetical protein